MIKFEDVKDITTEDYFGGNKFSIDAFNKKYKLHDEETYVQAVKRVCDFIASVEDTTEKRKYWSERWFDEIYDDWWHPAGSIMQGAGSGKKISLSNCTTISLGAGLNDEEWDNLESIIKNAGCAIAKCAAYRQGLGVDCSRIRPAGATIMNSANESTGSVHWMKFFDSIGYYVGQKGRSPAMLLSLNVSHPDIIDFIKVKTDKTKIQNANISVQCTNKFYEHVLEDKDWELSFEIPEVKKGHKVYIDIHSTDADCQYDEKKKKWYYIAKKDRPYQKINKIIKAREILELIAKGMCEYAEPGIQNIDVMRKYSNSDYVYDPDDIYNSKVISTNAPVVGSSFIPTKDGLITIKELYERREAYVLYDSFVNTPLESLNGSYKIIKKRQKSNCELVKANFKIFPNQTVYKIKLKNGFVQKCNGEHEWFTQDGMKKTHKIKSGDKIFCGNNGLVDALDLKHNINSQDFKDGSICGWFTGDGFYSNVYKSKGVKYKRKAIGFLWREDEWFIRDIFDSLYKQIVGKPFNYIRNRGNQLYETRVLSKEIYLFFKNFGYNGKSKYCVPNKCFINYDFCVGYLSSLFTSDGSFGNKRLALTLSNIQVLKKVQQLLLNWFGIQSYINNRQGKGVPYKLVDGTNKISRFKKSYNLVINKRIFQEIFRDKIGFRIERKNRKLEEYQPKTNKSRNFYNYYSVESISKTNQVEDMYCATVPGKHSLIINGLLSSNCSEQALSRDGCCILSSLNAGKFSVEPEQYEKELEKIAFSMNRFLDNVNTIEVKEGTYATPFQKTGIEKLRRTGAGYTNISAWLFKKNIEYGSEEGNAAIEKFTEKYNYYLYKSSIELGREKGNFGLFKREKFEKSPFIKRMMKLGLEFETMRNCTCSSCAPTGSLSLMFRDSVLSYGIEPAFGIYFWKRTRMAGHYEYYFCVPRVVRDTFREHGYEIPIESDTIRDTWDGKHGKPIAEFIDQHKDKIGIKFKSATEVSAMSKLDLMARVMKWIDSSISVTYMLPENSNWKDVYDFILEAYKRELKSIAAFPDKKMYGIVSFVPFRDLAKKLVHEGVVIHEQNFSEEELLGLYGKLSGHIQKTCAPKRPKDLPCDIYHVKITKKLDKIRTFDYIVLVGLIGEDPYEIFVAENGTIDKKHKRGIISKKTRGVYTLVADDKIAMENITKDCTESEDVLTRLVSCGLRHGADIHFVVQQLEKSKGDLFAFSKAISRCLKHYIPEDTKITGMTCSCGSNEFVRVDGCAQCVKCGFSKCG